MDESCLDQKHNLKLPKVLAKGKVAAVQDPSNVLGDMCCEVMACGLFWMFKGVICNRK